MTYENFQSCGTNKVNYGKYASGGWWRAILHNSKNQHKFITYSILSETNLAIRSISPFNVYSFLPYIAKKRSLQNYISNHKPIHKFVYNIVQKIPYFYRELLNCTCVRRFGAKVFILCISYLSTFGIRQPFRDGPLENLWGHGGGGGYSSKGK